MSLDKLNMLQEEHLTKIFKQLSEISPNIKFDEFTRSEDPNIRKYVLGTILQMDISKAEKSISISTFLRKETIGDTLNFSEISKYSELINASNTEPSPKPEIREQINQALNGILAVLIDDTSRDISSKLNIIENIYNIIQKPYNENPKLVIN